MPGDMLGIGETKTENILALQDPNLMPKSDK